MGILNDVVANRIETNKFELWGPDGQVTPDSPDCMKEHDAVSDADEYEIERDALTAILLGLVKDDAELIFDESVTSLSEVSDRVQVHFKRSESRTYDLVLGCDGLHSNIRKLWFAHEPAFAHFLKAYGSVSIVPRHLIEEGTTALYQAPGRIMVLTSYRGKTDIIALFSADYQLVFDRKDTAQQRALVAHHLAGDGWRVPQLLGEITSAEFFWFSDLSQIRMPSWSKGRVCLIGDAAFCPSPAAGVGGSLAIDGAAALGDAFAANPADYVAAFRTYGETFRPIVDKVQGQAIEFCNGISAGKIA